MTREEAIALIRDCAASDYAGETGGDITDAGLALKMWVEVELGMGDDSPVANALAVLGTEEAVAVYEEQVDTCDLDADDGDSCGPVQS